jgi:hypothetical protein
VLKVVKFGLQFLNLIGTYAWIAASLVQDLAGRFNFQGERSGAAVVGAHFQVSKLHDYGSVLIKHLIARASMKSKISSVSAPLSVPGYSSAT